MLKLKYMIRLTLILLLQGALPAWAVVPPFSHPGLLHSEADFARMAAKVNAKAQPWKASWDILLANSHAQLSYTMQGPVAIVYRGTGTPENYGKLYNDIAAAYACALRWKITGNTAYADKAVQIMNAWSSTLTQVTGTSDKYLAAGIYGYQFANVGEIMRTYSGLTPANLLAFQNMMRNIFYPMNADFLLNHNGACISHYWCNWDACNMNSMLAIGVLCDDRAIYQAALDYFKKGTGNGAEEYAVFFRHPGGLNQVQESGRDQGHNTFVMALMGTFCEMAWHQGDDLYSYGNNWLLGAAEYVAKYNLGLDVPYVTYVNCDNVLQPVISTTGRGSLRPNWELLLNHYVNRKGLPAPFTARFAATVRPEGGGGNYGPNSGGYDQLGYGSLVAAEQSPLTMPAPWAEADLGTVGTPGYAEQEGSTFVVYGSGDGLWTNSDEGHFMYQPATGDCSITARIVSLDNTNAIARAGVMLRAGAAANAPMASVVVTPSSGMYFVRRATAGSSAAATQVAGLVAPYWLRLVRSGTSVSSYRSPDGATWTLIGTSQVTLTGTFQLGLVTSSHADGTGCKATLDHVQMLTGDGAKPPAPSGASATAGIGQIELNWHAVASAVTYTVQRATTPGGPYAPVATNLSHATFLDPGLNTSLTYYYVINGVNAAGAGVNSAEVHARPADPLPTSWTSQDVGSVTIAGTAHGDGRIFVVEGAGTDIGGTADACHFASKSMTGDGVIITRLQNTATSGTSTQKVGLMMRESTAANARNAFLMLDSSVSRNRLSARLSPGAGTSFMDGTAGAGEPVWLKLQRVGNVFTGFASSTGLTWTQIGSFTIAMGNTIRVGLVSCSRNTGQLNATTFFDVSLPHQANFAWIGALGTARWGDGGNWSTGDGSDGDDGIPGDGGTTDTVTINAPSGTVIMDLDRSANQHSQVRLALNADATLNILPGAYINGDSTSGGAYILGQGTNTTGIINQTGGIFFCGNSQGFLLANGASSASYNLFAGTLNVARGPLKLGSSATSASLEAAVNVSGGSLLTRFSLEIGRDNAGPDSVGKFALLGSSVTAVTIGTDATNGGNLVIAPSGTLEFGIDPAGITPLQVLGGSSKAGGNVTISNGAVLKVRALPGVSDSHSATYDALKFTGTLTDGGLKLDPASTMAGFAFRWVDADGSGAPDTLRIFYTAQNRTDAAWLHCE